MKDFKECKNLECVKAMERGGMVLECRTEDTKFDLDVSVHSFVLQVVNWFDYMNGTNICLYLKRHPELVGEGADKAAARMIDNYCKRINFK